MDHLLSMKILGESKYNVIHKVLNSTSGEILVIKQINLINVNNSFEKKCVENEINILYYIKNYNHPNMIKLYNILQTSNHIFLALEFCNGGTIQENLEKYQIKYGKPFPEYLVQKIMKKILKGVKFLHDNGIIHRDLNLKNIMLQYENDFDLNNNNILNANVKIIDFNYSQISNNNMTNFIINKEVSDNIQFNNIYPYFDKKLDILSLGILCYKMLLGNSLFGNKTNEQIYNNMDELLCNLRLPKTISVQARTFLYCMIQKDRNNRWSVEQLLANEFITGNCQNFAKYDETNPYYNNVKTLHHSETTPKINVKNFSFNYSPLKTESNKNKVCKECRKEITNNIFKCEKCNNIIYCKKCYEKNMLIHNHTFIVIEVKQKSRNNDNIYSNYYNSNQIYNYPINNFIFKRTSDKDIVISQYNNILVRKLLEYYAVKINRPDLIQNYTNKLKFIYSGKNLNESLDQHVCDVFRGMNPSIQVIEINN